MHNFGRALKSATPFWPTLALAAFCSFAVAALWGANIGAFYPILEVTISGKSMHQWIDEEVAKADSAVQESLIATARRQALFVQDPSNEANRQGLAEAHLLLTAEQAKALGYHYAQPWIKRLPSTPFDTIAMIVVVLMVSTLIKHFFLITNEVLVGRVALDISRNIRMQVFEKAMGLDRASYARYGTSGFTARITHTTEMLSRGLMNTLGAALREPLKVVACLIGAGIICWRLLLLSVVIAPVVGAMLYWVTKRLREVSRNQLARAEGYHAVMLESLGNINTVQAYRMETLEQGRFGDATMAMRNYGLKFIFYTSLSKPIIEFLGLGMLGTTIIGGAYLVLNNETTLLGIQISEEPLSKSALLVFFGMLVGISDPLRKLSAVYSSMYAGCIAADALYPMLDHSAAIADPESPVDVPTPHRMLKLQGVEFGYNPEQPILKNVSLDIPFGSTVAIVGHNGSGKSTLIHLLSRFYDPNRGYLTLDDVDFRDMKVDDVRRRVALVNQHTELFNNTVAYNIRYGNPQASDEQVIWAAKQSHAHEFIMDSLEDGYETKVGQNGSKLSGGQRQRIALARALLCNPEILILDEATSQIDMHSEQLIRESLAEHRGERTMVIITHREKLLELADRVFEVVEGRLVEMPHLSRQAA
ncbi:MAG: ABC transporter ATP-binding protein [Planctomycetales bacterium]|nr:ABC transporter ATP-binding protein [Planctomycetales bacterium]